VQYTRIEPKDALAGVLLRKVVHAIWGQSSVQFVLTETATVLCQYAGAHMGEYWLYGSLISGHGRG